MYWTFEGEEDWRSDPIRTPVISENRIAFDCLNEEWAPEDSFMEMLREPDEYFHYRRKDEHYRAIRADISTHVVLTGTWRDEHGRGVFIAVLPKSDDDTKS
jgi:hypothetical protein